MSGLMPPAPSLTASPKRKRGPASVDLSSQSANLLPRLSTELNQSVAVDLDDSGSSRSVVAGDLQRLQICDSWVQQVSYKDAGRARKRIAQMSPEPNAQLHDQKYIPKSIQDQAFPKSDRLATHSHIAGHQPLPDLNGIDSTDRKFSRPRARSRSPPLDGDPDDNPLTWHESEITGHDPKDPEDDGYGINGIGFRPTPALAWSRSQKRKQQIAEYRSREAKEARQRRSERRRNVSVDIAQQMEMEGAEKSRVRFEEPIPNEN